VSVPFQSSAAERPVLRLGQRVRSTNHAPVFASDPKAGDQGVVLDVRGTNADSSSYLVRWTSGSESWAAGSSIEPMRIGDALPTTATPPAMIRGDSPARTPLARLLNRTTPGHKRLLGIVFLGLTLLPFAPGLIHFLRHPSLSGEVWFAVIPVFVILNGLRVSRRRPPPPSNAGVGGDS
jgi:hypothetical protein